MSKIIRYDLAWKDLIQNIEQRKKIFDSPLFDDILLSATRIIRYHNYITNNEVKRRYKRYGLTETVLKKKREEGKLKFTTRKWSNAFQYLYHETEIKKLVKELKNDRNNN